MRPAYIRILFYFYMIGVNLSLIILSDNSTASYLHFKNKYDEISFQKEYTTLPESLKWDLVRVDKSLIINRSLVGEIAFYTLLFSIMIVVFDIFFFIVRGRTKSKAVLSL